MTTIALIACGESLRRPPVGKHVNGDFGEVATKPPPPHVEEVGATPDPRAVWIDGEWAWSGTRWTWKRGGWVLPPAGATFAPWSVAIDGDGGVLFAPGAWRDSHGALIDAPATIKKVGVDASAPPAARGDGGA